MPTLTKDTQLKLEKRIITRILDENLPSILSKEITKAISEKIDLDLIINKVREAIPTPQDGKDAKITDDMISGIVMQVLDKISELHQVKNGKDGRDGRDGENYVLKESDIREIISRIRIPRDGKDADPYVLTEDDAKRIASLIPRPQDGKDGLNYVLTNADIDEIASRIRIPKDGKDGEPYVLTEQDIDLIVSKIPKPKDGIDGKEIDIDEIIEKIDFSAFQTVTDIDDKIKKLKHDIELGRLRLPNIGGSGLTPDQVVKSVNKSLGQEDWQRVYPAELADLEPFEILQLQNIDDTTISNIQWNYLSELNQSLTKTSDVTFRDLEISDIENTTILVKNIDTGNSYITLDSEQGESVVDLFKNGVRKWLISNYPTGDIFNIRQNGGINNAAFTILQNKNIGIHNITPTAALDLPSSVSTRATMRIRDGERPTIPNNGDIWKKVFPIDPVTNPASDRFIIKTSSGEFDVLAPHFEGEIKYIRSLDDLPAPVSGEITLSSGLYTFPESGFITPYTFIIPEDASVIIEGGTLYFAPAAPSVLFKTTGANGVGNGSLYVNKITLINTTYDSSLLNVYGDSSPNSFTRVDNCLVIGFGSLGSVTDVDIFVCIFSSFQYITQGIVITSINGIAFITNNLVNWTNVGTTMVTINGTIGIINIIGATFKPGSNEKVFYFNPAATFESGIVNSNTLNLNAGGQIFQSGSKDQTDIYWTYSGNTNLPDSTITAQGSAEIAAPLTTNIPAISAQVILNLGANWNWSNEERITTSTDGIITYIGLEPTTVLVDGNIELAPNLGVNQDLRTQFIKILACSPRSVTFTNATNTINETATPRANNDRINFYNTPGTLPTQLRKDVIYWVVNKLTDSFQISYTQGGAAVTFTDDGTPPNSYDVVELFGGIGRAQITNPIQLVPQSLVEISIDQQIAPIIWNDTTSNDIDSQYAFYRIKK